MARRTASEESSSWLEMQAILPEQTRPERPIDPERRLMLAVLHEAVTGYLAGRERSVRENLREIEQWFASDDTTWPYSFGNLCDALGLDRSAVRRALLLQRLERLAS
jgi:hypothetical protein